jgi:hypothetical protein
MDSSTVLNALLQQSKDLEHWEWVDDAWLFGWSAMVVLGVALELGLIAWEYREDLHSFRRGTIRSPERPSKKKLIFELAACALVVGGVAGELLVTRSISEIGTKLRIISNERVGIAEEVASRADEDAADARERAAKLESENLKLRQLVQPRSLTSPQQREIGKALREFSGRTVEVWSGSYNPESYFLSQSIVAALKKSEFDVKDNSGKSISSLSAGVTGILIHHSDGQADAAEAIRRALITHGGMKPKDVALLRTNPTICCPGPGNTPIPKEYLSVFVMARPLPKFE